MKTARLLSFFGALVLGLLLVRPVGAASILRSFKAKLSDPRPAVSTSHVFEFTTSTAGTYKNITVTYCKEPTWGGACTIPTGLGLAGVSTNALVSPVGIDDTWSLGGSAGSNYFQLNSTGQTFGVGGQLFSFTINNITNPAISGCNAVGNSSTGTCYVKVGTYSDASTDANNLIDSAVASITFVEQVSVTARVDATFTFVVDGVTNNEAHNGVTTSVSSSYNTLPFGALTAGTPKYAAHKLTVTTNTQAGYTVSIKMVTPMTGVYSANNIDPFPHVGSHSVWAEPTGNAANTNTGWVGYNTSDNEVENWTGDDTAQFAGVSDLTESTVMKSLVSDNGGASDYVSYALEVNVYQPADTYTGILYYNALPTY